MQVCKYASMQVCKKVSKYVSMKVCKYTLFRLSYAILARYGYGMQTFSQLWAMDVKQLQDIAKVGQFCFVKYGWVMHINDNFIQNCQSYCQI